jgi:hypothetical protein
MIADKKIAIAQIFGSQDEGWFDLQGMGSGCKMFP